MAVRRDGGHAQVYAVLGISVLDLMSAQNDLSSVGFADIVDRVRQLLLSVSVDAGDSHDLARPDLQVQVSDCVESFLILDIEVLDVQNDFPGFGRCLLDNQLD